MSSKIRLFDFYFINAENFDELLDEIFNKQTYIFSQKLPVLITPNVDQIVNYQKKENLELKNTLQNAQYILPDGQPLVWLSSLLKNSLKSRLAGSDFFPILWQEIKKRENKVLAIVANEKIGTLLQKDYSIIRFFVPPHFHPHNDEGIRKKIVSDVTILIQDFQPDFVIVGIGFPKQELITLDLLNTITATRKPLFFLLGASFEFYLGLKKRAPVYFQKLGSEWLYRLLQEPSRLWKRYLKSNTMFIFLALKELKNRI